MIERIALGLASLLLGGCVSWQHLDGPMPDGPDSDRAPLGSLSVVFSADSDADTLETVWHRSAAMEQWREAALDVLRESALFSGIREGLGQSDYRLELSVRELRHTRYWLATLSGITVGVLPYLGLSDFEMNARLSDRQQRSIGTYRSSGTRRILGNILLLPLAPLLPGQASVSSRLVAEMTRSILGQMMEDEPRAPHGSNGRARPPRLRAGSSDAGSGDRPRRGPRGPSRGRRVAPA